MTMDPVQVRIQTEGDVMLATIQGAGSIDASNASLLRGQLASGLQPGRHFVLSLEGIRSMDSAGIGVLVAVLKTIRKGGGRFCLVRVAPQVFSVLEMVRLTTVFETYPDLAAARAALAAAPALAPVAPDPASR